MTQPAWIALAPDQPSGVVVVHVAPADRRLVAGVKPASDVQSVQFGDALQHLADQTSGPLVLDLGEVDWIDSGACAVLIRFWKGVRANGRAVTLRVTPPVRETFQITGLNRLIPCFGERAEAIEAARTAQQAPGTGPTA